MTKDICPLIPEPFTSNRHRYIEDMEPENGWHLQPFPTGSRDMLPSEALKTDTAIVQWMFKDPVLMAQAERMSDTEWLETLQRINPLPVLKQVILSPEAKIRKRAIDKAYARRRWAEQKLDKISLDI